MVAIVQVPNGVGCGLGTVQLILYFIYRNNKGPTKKTIPDQSSMEMSNGKANHDKQNVANGSQNEQV